METAVEADMYFKRFGDEQSTLMDRYERLSFEVQLNQAMLGRSLSEPAVVRRQATPQFVVKPVSQGIRRRSRGSSFKAVLKKLLRPIIGNYKKGATKDNHHEPTAGAKINPMMWKKFGRSLRF